RFLVGVEAGAANGSAGGEPADAAQAKEAPEARNTPAIPQASKASAASEPPEASAAPEAPKTQATKRRRTKAAASEPADTATTSPASPPPSLPQALDTRACAIVDVGHVRERDLALELPPIPLEPVMANDVWERIYDRIAELAAAHRTTLVFVNTRRMAERLAR
ncbi:hypothetical protein, partial [Burkholderia ambifaria]|uniref:hypothetical protein n=1 Tax=Burkholderia ambifaria TaxID=152480 RepID=UPI001FC7F4E7